MWHHKLTSLQTKISHCRVVMLQLKCDTKNWDVTSQTEMWHYELICHCKLRFHCRKWVVMSQLKCDVTNWKVTPQAKIWHCKLRCDNTKWDWHQNVIWQTETWRMILQNEINNRDTKNYDITNWDVTPVILSLQCCFTSVVQRLSIAMLNNWCQVDPNRWWSAPLVEGGS